MNRILSIEHLSKSFAIHNLEKHIPALQDVNLNINEGEFAGITGRSGSGKSTLLKCIYRTYAPQQGGIWYESREFGRVNLAELPERQIIHLRKYEIGYVSQFLSTIPRTSARDLVQQAVMEMGHSESSARREADLMLQHFELEIGLWDSYPATFSGGERLRLNIARAMVKRPRLLLLDEPTASLDTASRHRVREIIEQLMEEGTTMLGIFHDMEFMANLCTDEYLMQDGRLAEAMFGQH